MSLRELTLKAGNVRLRALDDGSDDTTAFVLIHGLGGSAARWRDLIPHLARVRRTLAMDLPGFGRSDAPDGPYSMPWFAGAVREVMDSAGIERAVLVGGSMGGIVAIHLAAAEPSRIDALVLSAPALPLVARPARDVLAGFVAPMIPVAGPRMYRSYVGRRTPEEFIGELLGRNVADISAVPEETVAALVEEARDTAATPERARAFERTNRALGWAMTGGREATWRMAASVKAPVLIVWGDKDMMLPVATGEAAVARIPGSQLVTMEGCGHNPYMEAPERFARAVLTFLGEAPRVQTGG